ncbi:metallophosphoesterase [Paludibacter propionicigenes WB4]|uniref:Metallophosphoesterase n=1 Tax=Paludibacter propionicigenes (strain DSM 17365 / JCM 13257 / WB4) TaxID=694427 RepID=E4T305_PALPW|nr:metallophosphoesterase [Paludibacter propionicigenes]ADQ79099.1 metallophosphoesterase [Paludibacter propionicigenes WB4]
MKILIFGDVHGNLIALERLVKLEQSQVDFFVCHGDIVNYGPWTNECVRLLNDIPNVFVLKGNHEKYFIDGFYDGTNIVARASFEKCYASFDKSLVKVLDQYENQFQIDDFIIRHTIENRYIYANTNIADLKIDCNYIIGHSHQQFEGELNDYKLYNTGSLGQNRQFINKSCYLILNTDTKKVEFKSYIFDIKKVINEMKVQNYPQICIDYYLSKQQL